MKLVYNLWNPFSSSSKNGTGVANPGYIKFRGIFNQKMIIILLHCLSCKNYTLSFSKEFQFGVYNFCEINRCYQVICTVFMASAKFTSYNKVIFRLPFMGLVRIEQQSDYA